MRTRSQSSKKRLSQGPQFGSVAATPDARRGPPLQLLVMCMVTLPGVCWDPALKVSLGQFTGQLTGPSSGCSHARLFSSFWLGTAAALNFSPSGAPGSGL